MSKDFESRLRAALRPVSPSEDFSRRLIAQVSTDDGSKPARRRWFAKSTRASWWLATGLAASIILAVGVGQQLQHERSQRNGLEARRAVLQALRMTSQKLDLAYEAVKNESTSLSDEQSGV
jgi:hypothetical protein